MSQLPNPSPGASETAQSAEHLSGLSEKIWHELSEQVPLDQVDHLVVEAAAQYDDATVRTYVPLLIQRQVLEQLEAASGVATLLAEGEEAEAA